jgi:sugar lactone lactonase YvrE
MQRAILAVFSITLFASSASATTIPADALIDFVVDARAGWVSTGLQINQGDLFALEAEGTAWVAPPYTPERGEGPAPRGPGPCIDPACLLTQIDGSTAALVGMIGGSVFVVGSSFQGEASDSGILQLGFNDSDYSDNSGFFLVSTTAVVPEPSVVALMALGLVGLLFRISRRNRLLLGTLACLLVGGAAGAITINPGDFLVSERDAFGGPGGVIHVDPLTGAQTVVSSGGIFVNPSGIVIAANGDILVAEPESAGGRTGAVIRVDPLTGAQTIVSSGGSLVHPVGIAIDTSGDVLVVDASHAVIRVDPMTGDQTVVSSGGSLAWPFGIAIAPNGDILIADPNAFGGSGGLFRIDPVTGDQATVSSGESFVDPFGVAVTATDIFVAERDDPSGTGAVIRVDPLTGTQTIVSSGGNFAAPEGITLACLPART